MSLGLVEIFKPEESKFPAIDIVAVHGLGADPSKAWKWRQDRANDHEVNWLKDFLPQKLASGERPVSATVLCFNYTSQWLGSNLPRQGLKGISNRLLHAVLNRQKLNPSTANRPLLFIGHSFGGLVIEQAVVSANADQPAYKPVLQSLSGVFLLGTPHRGSSSANLGSILARSASVLGYGNNENLKAVAENSLQINDMVNEFVSIAIALKLQENRAIVCFYENLLTNYSRRVPIVGNFKSPEMIVNEPSATLHAFPRDYLDSDHLDLNRYKSIDDSNFISVSNHISRVAAERLYKRSTLATKTEDHKDSIADDDQKGGKYHRTNLHLYSSLLEFSGYHVGRAELLAAIRDNFFRLLDTDDRWRVVVLVGIGGQGKTRLAIDYCKYCEKLEIFGHIFWVDASSLDNARRGLRSIAAALAGPEREFTNDEEAIKFAQQNLCDQKEPWLIVYDSCDDSKNINDLVALIPRGKKGSVLITSRHSDWFDFAKVIPVERMTEEESIQLLLSGANSTDCREKAEQIVDKLGYHPLAIRQASTYLLPPRNYSLDKLSEDFDKRKEEILKTILPFRAYTKANRSENKEKELSAFTTWELMFDQIGKDEQERAAIETFLTVCAFFDPRKIGEDLFESHSLSIEDPKRWKRRFESRVAWWRRKLYSKRIRQPVWMDRFLSNGCWDSMKYEQFLLDLSTLSVIQNVDFRGEIKQFSLHPLISEWLKIRAKEKYTSAIEARDILCSWIYQRISTFPSRPPSTPNFIAHLDFLRDYDSLEECGVLSIKSDFGLESAWLFGHEYECFFNYQKASQLLEGIIMQVGPSHGSTYEVALALGRLYHLEKKLEKAEEMLDQAHTGHKKAFGPDDPSYLNSVGALGRLYGDQGKLEEAEKLLNQALTGYEKALGPDHPLNFAAVRDLGHLYRGQGKLDKAEEMLNQVLSGYQKALDPDHPVLFVAVHDLGCLYRDQGKLDKAEEMLNQALKGYEKVLGPYDYVSLNAVNGLGALYDRMGNKNKAEEMYQRALLGYTQTVGPDHTLTLGSAFSLGIFYQHEGKLDKAEEMLNQAVTGYEKVLGPYHHLTLETVDSLGVLYQWMGKEDKAEEKYKMALLGYKKANELETASCLDTVFNLGALYDLQGKLEQAEELLNQALTGYEKVLGPDHRSFLDTVYALGGVYYFGGKLDEAEKKYRTALFGYEKTLGPDHIRISRAAHNLGNLYHDQGKLDTAEAFYNRALATYKKSLPSDHKLISNVTARLEHISQIRCNGQRR